MEEKLWAACQSPEITLGQALEVLNNLVTEYDQTTYGSAKWKKFRKFLQNSLEGPLLGITKRRNNQITAETTAIQMKCRSVEDRLTNAEKQLDGAKRETDEWKRRYESIVAHKEATVGRHMALQKIHNDLEEKYNEVSHQVEVFRKEASDWRTRFEVAVKAEEEQLSVEIGALQIRSSAAEGRLAAAREQLQSAREEALEWRRKHDIASEELLATSERGTQSQCDTPGKPDDKRTSTSGFKDSDDSAKFTIPRLKQELTKAGFGEQLLQCRNASKKEILNLYERLVLQRSV